MNTDKKSSTGLSEVKNTELKSIYEKILYSKVYGAIDRQAKRFGIDSVQRTVDYYGGFLKKVKTDSYYAKAIDGMYDHIIEKVVDLAQTDFLNNNQVTYETIQSEFNQIRR